MQIKKVAVTGASGHIGANLVRALLDRGYQVVALVRETSSALEGLDVTRVPGDILDLQSLCRAFNGVEQVYHLAAYISIQAGEREKLESINIRGTGNVIKACQSEAVSTLIYFSTVHALDLQPLDREVTEDNQLLRPGMGHGIDYDYSKAQAERLIRDNESEALGTRIIYPSGVFGPNDFKLSLFGQAILKMANRRLPALVAGGFDWVDARDVAWGAIEAAEKGTDKDRYILSGHDLSMSEVAGVIADLSGVAAPRFCIPLWLAKLFAPLVEFWARLRGKVPLYTRDSLSALSGNRSVSHSRATRMLGYQPRSFRSSMKDTLQFHTRQGSDKVNRDGF